MQSPQPGGVGAAAGTYVSKQQLGDLVQEFAAYPNGEQGLPTTAVHLNVQDGGDQPLPVVVRHPEVLGQRCSGESSSRDFRRVRS